MGVKEEGGEQTARCGSESTFEVETVAVMIMSDGEDEAFSSEKLVCGGRSDFRRRLNVRKSWIDGSMMKMVDKKISAVVVREEGGSVKNSCWGEGYKSVAGL